MSPVVRQFIVGAARSDAITTMALDVHRELSASTQSELYAYHSPEESLAHVVHNRHELPTGAPEDLFVYHSSYGIPDLTRLVRERTEKLVLVYHNITPSDRYWDYDPDFAAALEWGRRELELIRPKVVRAVADSRYNADELTEIGYEGVTVIPAGMNPYRLSNILIDTKFNRELGEHFPDGFILFVSQSIPHKRVELAMEVVHLLRSVHRMNVGLVVAGPQRNSKYKNVIDAFREKLPEAHVLMAGEVTESMLATLYRRAILLLGTSDHEGLGNPPLEAMAEGCPVVIRGCGAVPDTVGSGGIVLPPDAGVLEITEATAAVINSPEMQLGLSAAGRTRVGRFMDESRRVSIVDVLREVMA
mgnify:CR=1 FL=1